MTHRVERHKWWTSDRTRLVNSGDPEAAILAYPAGTELAESEALRLGLLGPAPTLVASPDEAPAEKMRAAKLSNKVGPRPSTKAVAADEETL